MTDLGDLPHRLLPPDPDDAPGWADWPAPARRRVALSALLDRIAELTVGGGRALVLVPDADRGTWRGLGALLHSYGAPAEVRPAGEAFDGDAERVVMPADAPAARLGYHGAALLGATDAPVRYLGVTVAGNAGTADATGPWPVLTDEGWRGTLTRAALLEPLLTLRPGQRLQAMVLDVGEPAIVSAWH